MGLGLVMGLGGCLVLGGNGTDPNDAVCVVDYDECLDLGVDEGICQAIYDACEGDEGGGETGDPGDDGGDCWDQVQQCLEENGGDEEQCQGIIDECQGGEDDGQPPGDDGMGCWEEVEWCYDNSPDPQECEDLAQQCLGDDGNPDDGGDGGNQCEEILEQCAEQYGEQDIPEECWHEYEQCVDPGDPPPCEDGNNDPACCNDGCCAGQPDCPGDCEQQYNECVDSGESEEQCAGQYQQCVGQPPGDDGGVDPGEACFEVADACQQVSPGSGECDALWDVCEQGSEDCVYNFYECMGLEFGDIDAVYNSDPEQAAQCVEEMANCG
ncbi:MAG: hypothetical protein AAF721_05185 [Myxococcota bacterium]